MMDRIKWCCTETNDDGAVTAHCLCGWSEIHDTETAADRAVSRHHAEKIRNNGVHIAPVRPGRRWSNREIDAVLEQIWSRRHH
jgi:hypothetical protein